MLQHLLRVGVCDQERYVIALKYVSVCVERFLEMVSNLDWLAPKDEEGLRSLRKESCELVYENVFDLVSLFYVYADPHAIDTRLDQHLFVFIPCNSQRIQ